MEDETIALTDTVLLDYLGARWCRIEMTGGTIGIDGDDEPDWEVTPERYNPAVTGQGGTLREAIRSAIRRNGGSEDNRGPR
jgi:hypothetical protein